MTDLTSLYAPDDPPQSDEDRDHWRVTNDGECQWALLKLARAEQELARIKARADELVAHAEHFRRSASAGPQSDADFFRGAAADYHRRRLQPVVDDLTADGVVDKDAWSRVKGRTYPLPVGTLTATRGQERVEVEDEDAFIEWAVAGPGWRDFVRLRPNLLTVKGLPRVGPHVVVDGEIVPGLRVTGGQVTYDAKATVVDEQPAFLPWPESEDVA